jgi:hypothetical protein
MVDTMQQGTLIKKTVKSESGVDNFREISYI